MAEDARLVATRNGYDAIARAYAELFRSELDDAPLDRAVLQGFAELVGRDHPGGQVLEVGSGPGGVTAHLSRLGLDVSGIDLSPAMVDLAAREHPGLSFAVGEMGALDHAAGSLAGLVSWYSLIHVPEPRRPAVVAGFARVLRPGGYLLLGFQVGDGTLNLDEAFGTAVSLDFHRLRPDAVVGLLEDAGFDVVAQVVRAPEPTSNAAKLLQGSVIARRRP
ncbi:class I SAM-dependent DNA methyltransferase [Blastococcus sp. SYSU D00922]